MTADGIQAYASKLRKRCFEECTEISDEDLLAAAEDAGVYHETVVYCAAVVMNPIKDGESKNGCFTVVLDDNDHVTGSIPEKWTHTREQAHIYAMLKALQLYGNATTTDLLVVYCTNGDAVRRVNDALHKGAHLDDDLSLLVRTASTIGFDTYTNKSETKLNVRVCASVKYGTKVEKSAQEFECNTPSWWTRRCECLALRSSYNLMDFKYRRDKCIG